VHAEYLEGTRIEELLRATAPDLLIADVVSLSPLQFAAHALGIPVLQVCTSLSQRHGARPPLISPLCADTPPLLLEAERWATCCVRSFDAVPHTGIMTALIDAYCARYAYPPADLSFDSVFWPALKRYRELVLCEAAFDLPSPGETPDESLHLATPVDVEREEEIEAPIRDFVGARDDIVYASLGSLPGRYPHGPRFFREFIGAMRAMPQRRAVLATGRYLDDTLGANLPQNVLIVRRAPQLWLLRRAAVFVTHAGLGSVREAIELGVPMVAVPQQHDQPGNATRITHHGIGLSIGADVVTARGLQRAIDQVCDERDAWRGRVRRLADECRRERASSTVLELIEAAGQCGTVMPAEDPAQSARAGAAGGWLMVGGVAGILSLRDGGAPLQSRAAPDLSAALRAAGGSLLARIEPGAAQAWFIQAEDLLFEHASWCAEQTVSASAQRDPLAAQAFMDMLQELRALRARGDDAQRLELCRRAFAASSQLWHEGFAALGAAGDWSAPESAHGASWLAMHALARAAAGHDVGTPAGVDAYRRRFAAERARFTADLEHRVTQRAAQAGIAVTA
jgi:MGT family glycosyltransferase